jgi:hypothetical protein
MKKLLLLSFLVVLSMTIMAQSATVVAMNNNTYAKYTPDASDTIGGTAVKYWVFFVNKPNLYYYVSTVRFDQKTTVARSIGNHVTLALLGSIDGTNYVSIDTALIHPSASHNQGEGKVLNWSYDVSTGVIWRYLKVQATGGDANKGATLVSLSMKIGNRY